MGDEDDPTQPFADARDQPTDAHAPRWRALPPEHRPHRTMVGILLGMVTIVVLAAIGGFLLTRGQVGFGIFQSPPVGSHETTPVPTALSTGPVPTAAPTTAGQVVIPTPAPGFQTFAAQDGVWASNYPHTVLVGSMSLTIQGIMVPATVFVLGQGGAVTVYEVPPALAATSPQELFDELVLASGATNVTVLEQPTTSVIGANSWERSTLTAQQNGQANATVLYFAHHGGGALVISTSAPADSFPDDAQQDFGPMIQSFTFLR